MLQGLRLGRGTHSTETYNNRHACADTAQPPSFGQGSRSVLGDTEVGIESQAMSADDLAISSDYDLAYLWSSNPFKLTASPHAPLGPTPGL
jgi:hypothetical protein